MILVVDDDRDMRTSLRVGLERRGYGVLEAESGEEALEILGKHTDEIHVVLLDMRMPGMGGRGFLEKYQSVSPTSKVVILTGYPSLASAVQALSGGPEAKAQEYLLKKPTRLKQIVETIDHVIGNVQAGDFRIDLREPHIGYYKDEPFDLTPTDARIFLAFLRNPARDLTYQDLALVIRNTYMPQDEARNSIRAQVWRVRKKMEEMAGREVIGSQAGRGFFWNTIPSPKPRSD